MKKILLILTLVCFAVSSNARKGVTPQNLLKSMKQVAEWQMNTPLRHKLYDWTNGALYTGMMAYGRLTNDGKSFNWLRQIGDSISWKTGPRNFMADDYCVGSTFCELFLMDGDSLKIKYFKSIADDTEVYGVGAFLLAGSEIYKMRTFTK